MSETVETGSDTGQAPQSAINGAAGEVLGAAESGQADTTPAEQTVETAPPAEPSAEPANDWIARFEGEDLGWLQNRGLQGKTVEEALDNLVAGQRNAEKRLGVPQDRLVVLPADPTSEGAMNSVWDSLGRPEDAAGYELDGGDTELTKTFASDLAGAFHQAGLTKDQGQAVEGFLSKFLGEQYDSEQSTTRAQRAASYQSLQDEWGDTFDLNVALAKEAVSAAGATKEEIEALVEAFGENGDAKVIKFFNRLGQKRGVETSFVSGDNTLLGLGATTPEAARAKMQEMKADPKLAKELLANNSENATVKQYRALAALAAKRA